MGFNYYLYTAKKTVTEELSTSSYEELVKKYGEDDWLYTGHLPLKELHSNGDLNSDEVERIKRKGTPLFKDSSMENTELDVVRVGKEGLKELIEAYRERVIQHLKKTLGEEADYFGRTPEELRESYTRSLLNEWENFPPYNLLKGEEVTSSAKYEYIIFELVRLYKTISDEDDILFAGH